MKILLLFLPIFAFSQIKIPPNYVKLKSSPSNGRPITMESAFLDNDSVEDTALLVVNENKFSSYKLLIYLTSIKKQFEIELNSTNDFHIYPLQLKVSKNVIEYGYYEDGTSTFGRFIKLRYNSNKKNMQVIGYDVEYKSSMTKRVKKTYNLLTGKYIVTKTEYKFDDSTEIETNVGKNTHFQNKIFINNLTVKTLQNLDEVGSKFE